MFLSFVSVWVSFHLSQLEFSELLGFVFIELGRFGQSFPLTSPLPPSPPPAPSVEPFLLLFHLSCFSALESLSGSFSVISLFSHLSVSWYPLVPGAHVSSWLEACLSAVSGLLPAWWCGVFLWKQTPPPVFADGASTSEPGMLCRGSRLVLSWKLGTRLLWTPLPTSRGGRVCVCPPVTSCESLAPCRLYDLSQAAPSQAGASGLPEPRRGPRTRPPR